MSIFGCGRDLLPTGGTQETSGDAVEAQTREREEEREQERSSRRERGEGAKSYALASRQAGLLAARFRSIQSSTWV